MAFNYAVEKKKFEKVWENWKKPMRKQEWNRRQ